MDADLLDQKGNPLETYDWNKLTPEEDRQDMSQDIRAIIGSKVIGMKTVQVSN